MESVSAKYETEDQERDRTEREDPIEDHFLIAGFEAARYELAMFEAGLLE